MGYVIERMWLNPLNIAEQGCGPLPQAPQSTPGGNNKGKGFHTIAVLAVVSIAGYLIYREWKRKKDIDKK